MIERDNIPQGYKCSKLGTIPCEWEIKKLGEVCTFLDSQRIPIKDADRGRMQGVYPYYGASGIIDYVNDYIFDEDLILLGEDGANIITRSTPLAFLVSGKVWVNNHAHVLRVNNGYSRYCICNYLETLSYEKYNTGTAQPKLNREICEKIPLLLPPIEEQKRIAEVLSEWDKAIELQTKLIEKLELRKRALMQRLLTGRVRLNSFSGKWKKVRFGEILKNLSNGFTYDVNDNGEIPISRIETISTGDINYNKVGHVKYTKQLETYRLNSGDLLYSHINSLSHIGKVAYYDGRQLLYHGMNLLRIIVDRRKCNQKYLYYYLTSKRARHRAVAIAKPAVNQASISVSDLSAIKLMIPEITEQNAIAERLEIADKEIEIAKTKLSSFRNQKKGLMQQLLTGKKRII